MRWDRHQQSFLFQLLIWLGKPFFWLTYVILAGIVTSLQHLSHLNLYAKVAQKTLRQLQPRPKKFRPIQTLVIAVFICLIGSIAAFYQYVVKGLPSPSDLVKKHPAVTTKIYDRNGLLLYKIYHDENRTLVPLSDIPPHVINATVAIEDAAFYQHPGFSIKGIIRALRKNAAGNSIQGGSTITQQLVKNTLLSSERTLTRKLKELWLSLFVEYYFTKDEILSMYINEVGYGGTAYGIEAAAEQYFGKSVKEVSLAEAALLAGLPQSPTMYSPFGASPELAIARQHQVITRMVEEGYITIEAAKQAEQEILHFNSPKTDINAPHFVMWVKDQLVKQYGETILSQEGLEVITTLDSRIQALAEEAVKTELTRLTGLNVTNAAAIVANPQTGEILAMVGSADYFNTQNDGQVNVTLRPRQPGSSIKPLTYALALSEHLLTPATLIDDVPIVYSSPGSPPYAPQNYDGRFHGKVTVRQSLANSYNIPAVKTLAQVGVSNLVNFATSLGISTWTNPSRFGLSLTLGSGEVRMLDMVQAYGIFAAGGRKISPTPLIRVINSTTGQTEEFICQNNSCNSEPVLDPGVAFLISDILADNQARSAAFGTRSVLVVPNQQVAVKTGTTNDMRDNWTFGYTHDFLVATWVGNNNNSPMSRVASGITGASPIWQTIMKGLLANQPTHTFSPPPNVTSAHICTTNKLEYFLIGTEPKNPCTATPSPSPEIVMPKRDQLLDGVTHTRLSPRDREKPTGKNRRQQ